VIVKVFLAGALETLVFRAGASTSAVGVGATSEAGADALVARVRRGAGVSAIGSAACFSAASALFAVFRVGFLVTVGAASTAGAAALAADVARGLRAVLEVPALVLVLRRALFGISSSENNDGLLVGSVITAIAAKLLKSAPVTPSVFRWPPVCN